jgi:nucleolar protein 9
MPREHRKRGQRKKKFKEGEESREIQETPNEGTNIRWTTQTQPSWIEDAPEAPAALENNFEAPWGYVDPDVKAYFRTVAEQMLEWQATGKLQRDEAQMDKDPSEGGILLAPVRISRLSMLLLRTPTIFRRSFAGNARQRVTTGHRPGLLWYTRTYGILYG